MGPATRPIADCACTVCDPQGVRTAAFARPKPPQPPDVVNSPPHYTSDPSGVECIAITRHRSFNIGNAIKYLWRQGLKVSANRSVREKQIEDLQKAVWYITDEIALLKTA